MLGSILGAIGSLASSFLDKSSADKQMEMQKDFAQKGIQWKVKDAEAAGIHPLYALGANTVSYSPVSVGQPDLGAMGQDIGGAIDRVSNPVEKSTGALGALALERAGLENDLLRAQIARARINTAGQVAMGPLAPVSNQELLPGWDVARPNLGQAAENAYSEIGGNVFGGLGMVADAKNAADRWEGAKTPALSSFVQKYGPYGYYWREAAPVRSSKTNYGGR